MSNAFKAYMKETYSHNELADIAMHGCASCAPGGMIYYSETTALFDQYRDDLFSIMADYQDETGATDDYLPDYVRRNAGAAATFANAVVWFCAELVAYELTQGEYIDDTKEAA